MNNQIEHNFRRTISLFALLLFSITTLVGCETTGSAMGPDEETGPAISPSEAKRLSYHFEVGAAEDDIVAIIGYPTLTEVRTCGTSTDNPWDCRILKYIWEWEGDELWLFFHRIGDGWSLNNWSWY